LPIWQVLCPFDTKDERIIELGEYASTGLTYAQGEQAKISLQESLKIVLADAYVPPSPLRDVAANASVDQLAPDNPLAAEMAQIRESLEEIRGRVSGLTQDETYYTLSEILELNRLTLRELRRITPTGGSSEEDLRSPEAIVPAAGRRTRGGSGLSSLLMPELQRIAQTLAIPGAGHMRKSQLVVAIEARQRGQSMG